MTEMRRLDCNKEGLTLRACEYFQRAGLAWKVGIIPIPEFNVLLSLANMFLKLGQPAPALLAYTYVLSAEVRRAACTHFSRWDIIIAPTL